MLKSFLGRAGAEFNTYIDEDAWARLADAMTYISATLISMKTCAPLSTRPKKQLEGELLDTCRALGIAVTAYGVLARGLLGGHLKPSLPADDYRNFSARFQGENLRSNLDLAERLRASAIAMHATPA